MVMFIPDSRVIYKMKLTPWTTWWFIIMWRDDVESILFTYLNFSASYHTTSLDFFYRYKALQDLDTYYYDWSNQTVPATKLIQLWNKFGSEAPNLPDITDIMDLLDYTANIFEVIFTVFNCVPISTVVSLYGLHLIAAPSTVE